MKSYYKDDLTWTTEGNDIAREVAQFLGKLYKRELGNGMNVRELTAIINHTACGEECGTVMRAGMEKRKAARANK